MPDRYVITVADLKDQIGMNGPRPFLYCRNCHGEFSADRGDYFMLPKGHVMKCCGRHMRLVTEKRVLMDIKP